MTHLLPFLITPAEQRTPYTRYNAGFALLPFFAHAVAAYIRYRRPSTPLFVRLVLAVVSVVVTLRVSFAHYRQPSSAATRPLTDVAVDVYCGAIALSTIISVLDMLFTRDAREFDVKGASEHRRWLAKRGEATKEYSRYPLERPLCFPGTRVPLELDVLWSLRGLGYERGASQHGKVAYEAGYAAFMAAHELRQRPLHEARAIKWRHVGSALRVCMQCYAVVDVCDSFARHPTVMPSTMMTLDDARRGILGALGPWVMTVLQCVVLVALIQLVSTSFYIVALTSTSAYDAPITISRWQPLVMGQPHRSTSVRALWSREWHALLRRTFVVGGYRPARCVADVLHLPRRLASAFGTFGAFFVSGVLHEVCLEAVVPYQQRFAVTSSPHRLGFGARHFYTTRFFLAMAVAVCVEDVWQSTLERRVAAAFFRVERVSGPLRSVLGWTWCMAYMTYFGHGLIDVWLEHGMAVGASSAQLSRPVVDAVLSMFA